MHKSIKKSFLFLLNLFFIVALVAFLGGCGGSADSGGGDGGGGDDPTPTGVPTLTLVLSSITVSYGTPITATATLRDENGALVDGAVVTFAATSNLVSFTPSSATDLTGNAGTGRASVSLNAASIDSAGATYISASATITSGAVTSSPVGLTVNAVTVTLGSISLGTASISAYGTTSVSVPVFIGGSPATTPVSVSFSSSCASSGLATLSSPVNSISGTATSTYKDNGCGGDDVITASVTGDSEQATLNIASPATNNIQFVSAVPEIIATSTASASSLPTSSLVTFKVVDSSNNGIAGVLVDFAISPDDVPGGITLSTDSATSDANGEVATSLSSGTVPTPVWVVATVHGTTLKSQSNTLTITTGLPAQDFFSVSASKYNIEGLDYDGEESTFTIIASDRLGNPVPDGTAINFVTEGSQFSPATCSTVGGTCSTTFRSSEFRPANGRVTIVAYAVGEKSFVDTNGNNAYDAGETFYDLGVLYIDANENGAWDTVEQYYNPPSAVGSSACLTRPSGDPLPFNYEDVQSKENTCNATWGQHHVRRSRVVVLSGSYADISPTLVDMEDNCSQFFTLWMYDENGNAMPAETTVSVKDNDVYYIPYHEATEDPVLTEVSDVSIVGGTPVPSSNSAIGTPVVLRIRAGVACLANTPDQYPFGTAFIEVTTPKGNITTIPITVTGNNTTP